MRLNLKEIIHVPGGVCPFDYQLDLSGLDFSGAHPIDRPVAVRGQVRNMAGALLLEGTASTTLHLTCDRCGKPLAREKVVPLETLLATELSDERSDDEIVLLEGDEVDLDEVAATAFVLAMESKNLCSEDCKGLCPGCGADLNVEACRCRPEVDPRLAALAQLLEQEERE
ncbi:DUF177 domain-containing protein [uncultured Intestinimonas sp.]|uniref:YceD family protein n=1 Tax=uncultured Intestinimonas sp. TaxID=1689265 RepID=UPI0025D140F4|nr:DUF177 domain-containing protein [uncultured Intestinimonas sp.]